MTVASDREALIQGFADAHGGPTTPLVNFRGEYQDGAFYAAGDQVVAPPFPTAPQWLAGSMIRRVADGTPLAFAASEWTSVEVGAVLLEFNTTALTSAAIDALFPSAPPNGTTISDPTNHLALTRQAGKWAKTAALTAIA